MFSLCLIHFNDICISSQTELCSETYVKIFDGIFYLQFCIFVSPGCRHDCIIVLHLSVSSRTLTQISLPCFLLSCILSPALNRNKNIPALNSAGILCLEMQCISKLRNGNVFVLEDF